MCAETSAEITEIRISTDPQTIHVAIQIGIRQSSRKNYDHQGAQ